MTPKDKWMTASAPCPGIEIDEETNARDNAFTARIPFCFLGIRITPFPKEVNPLETVIQSAYQGIETARFTPVSTGLGVDGRGRIWVLTVQKAVSRAQMPKDYVIQDYVDPFDQACVYEYAVVDGRD